jgi:uncharacterized protein YdbL (DUF1318 family)
MKRVFLATMVLFLFACAKVSVETKEPIKVDINMRVDVYQHVIKDAESINDEIYGTKEKNINALFGLEEAYAADLSSETNEAISRRKARAAQITKYFNAGYVGENKDALLSLRYDVPADLENEIKNLISEENKDREIIYAATAEKNGASLSETKKIFFQDDYKRAPSSWWFETEEGGSFIWKQK